jgi:glyoxylate reductase
MVNVLYTFKTHKSGIQLLKDHGFHVVYFEGRRPPKNWICEKLNEADAVVIPPYLKVDEDLVKCGQRLKLIVVHGSGYENIDLEACNKHGICLSNSPDALADAVAEYAIAITLALLRNIVRGDIAVRKGKWFQGPAPREFLSTSLRGKIIGIIGMGRIGSKTAALFKALGAEVIYWSRRRKFEVEHSIDIKYVELDELLSSSDVIVLSMALTPETKGFLNKQKISKMSKKPYIVNVARGDLIVEEDLIEALKNGTIRGAALDVFEKEPIPPTHPLNQFPNVILTPHIAGYTIEAISETSINVAKTIIRFFIKRKPPYTAINPSTCLKTINTLYMDKES